MRFMILCAIGVLALNFVGCTQPCESGNNACYKAQYLLVPDETKASGYRYLTIGELFFGERKATPEKNIGKN